MAKLSPINLLADPPEIHFMVPGKNLAMKSSGWDMPELEVTLLTYKSYYNQVTTALAGVGDINLSG